MRGGCIANIGSCGTGFDSASGSVRTNRFRAEGLELADREGEKNKAVPTIESIHCSSMDEALSFASRAKCDERLVFPSLCTLSCEPLFRERLAPLLREAKLIFPPLLGLSSATGLRLLRKVRFLPNSVREGTKVRRMECTPRWGAQPHFVVRNRGEIEWSSSQSSRQRSKK
eukprot:Gb_08714 [translate_table: standard]